MKDRILFAVGSQNPVKTACVREAVSEVWPLAEVAGIGTESGVSAQPMTEEETFEGAVNRARSALTLLPDSSYGVGVEGGLVDQPNGMWAFAVVVIAGRDGFLSHGQTGRFRLPEGVANLIRHEGLELGHADDRFFGRENSKQKEGAIGILSDGRISRMTLYKPAVTFALLPLIHPEYYSHTV